MAAIGEYQLHEYEPTTECTNFIGGPTEIDGNDGCTHRQYRSPHCAQCGDNPTAPWHKEPR